MKAKDAKVTAKEMIITPEMAGRILEKNTRNRPINSVHVRSLAKDMTNGTFKFNGDTIALNGSMLIDGQHRLHAVILSGVPTRFLVVDGLNDDVFDTKDIGRHRSGKDALHMIGQVNTSTLAAMLRLIHQYKTKTLVAGYGGKMTPAELLDVFNAYPGAGDSIPLSYRNGAKKQRLITGAVAGACHYLLSEKDPDLATLFFDTFHSGESLKNGDPILVLRNRMIANNSSQSRMRAPVVMALIIKTWNAWISGKKIQALRYSYTGPMAEEFPTILDVSR